MKIMVNFNAKQPMAGVDFGSVGAGISIEREIGEGKSEDEIKALARHLYGVSRKLVETELGQLPNGNGTSAPNGHTNGRNGNGHRPVSEKQRQFIISLVAQKRGSGGLAALEGRLGKAVSELTRKEASALITEIKGW